MKEQGSIKKPLTIVFCLPGSDFSGRFLECWTELVSFCLQNNIRPILSRRQSCNIYFVRKWRFALPQKKGGIRYGLIRR